MDILVRVLLRAKTTFLACRLIWFLALLKVQFLGCAESACVRKLCNSTCQSCNYPVKHSCCAAHVQNQSALQIAFMSNDSLKSGNLIGLPVFRTCRLKKLDIIYQTLFRAGAREGLGMRLKYCNPRCACAPRVNNGSYTRTGFS